MRYEAPYCPWCPSSIRAWREGQPFYQVSSISNPSGQAAVAALNSEAHAAALGAFARDDSARIAEIVRFARRRGYRKIGIAACVGSESAAQFLCARLARAGFDVVTPEAVAQTMAEAESWLPELAVLETIWTERRCNPAAQAKWLNAEGSDFNVAVGLCVGCDSVFFHHAEAPTTVLPAGRPAADLPQLAAERVEDLTLPPRS